MEHSSHAHPLSDGQGPPPRLSSRSSYTSPTSVTRSLDTLAISGQQDGVSQQTRRLQLRNSRFSGSPLPARRINPFFGVSPYAIEPFNRPSNHENSPLSAEKRSTYGEDLPPSPVNILQEIQNSARRTSTSSRRSLSGAIAQEKTMAENGNDANGTSWYNERSSNESPSAFATTSPATMKLREVSLNQKLPSPVSTPLVKHVKGRNRKTLNLRSASYEASQYIEHLESELASANAKLDSLMSPKTIKLRSAKLRALTVEVRDLRQQLAEWEKKFADRVLEEREQRSEFESELKIRLQTLEEEVEMKDARLGELEWEVEGMRAKVRDAEGLEEINIGLEKKVDMLTNLLARGVPSTSTSPTKVDSAKRTPRPRSMLTRMPSSPGGVRLPLIPVSNVAFWHSRNLGSSSSISESPEGDIQPDQEQGRFESPMGSPGSNRTRFSGSLDHRSRHSVSFRSAPSSTSRPTSSMSASSTVTTSWGLPLPAVEERKTSQKQRKMRRFPSGSNSIKPLILPTATTVPSLPVSAPIYPSIETTATRDFSDMSLDPTTSVFSKFVDDSPVSTPTQPSRKRSSTWVQEQTLKALEGKHQEAGVAEVFDSAQSSITIPAVPTSNFRDFSSGSSNDQRSRPQSLQKELEQAEMEQAGLFISTECGTPGLTDDGLVPAYDGNDHESSQILIGVDSMPLKAPSQDAFEEHENIPIGYEITPKPLKYNTVATPQPLKASITTALTQRHAYGIFSRLTHLMFQTKQDPFELARRILANAWAVGSRRFGGTGWWLLGLIYHRRRRKRPADTAIDEPTPPSSAKTSDWQHFSAEASSGKAAGQHYHDYGSTWMSPPHLSSSGNRVLPSTPSRVTRKHPLVFPCDDCTEPSSRRSLRLWFRFSLAMVLAVGIAVIHGPGTLLAELPNKYTHQDDEHPQRGLVHAAASIPQQPVRKHVLRDASGDSRVSGSVADSRDGGDSAYGSIVFAETLVPSEFHESKKSVRTSVLVHGGGF